MKWIIQINGQMLSTKYVPQFWQSLHDFIAYVLANLGFLSSFLL